MNTGVAAGLIAAALIVVAQPAHGRAGGVREGAQASETTAVPSSQALGLARRYEADGRTTRPADAAPSPGDIVVSEEGALLRGWRYSAGGLITDATGACCLAYFTRGDRNLVAITQPLTRDPRGGVRTARILRTLVVTVGPREIVSEGCFVDGRQSAFAVMDVRTNVVRAFFTDGSTFTSTSRPLGEVEETCTFEGAYENGDWERASRRP